ncbi:hypothetical protein ACERK3_04605 [Phycisphaerales bacterium AB-hyl4]|uniref:Uncharacterized protein n=1 Tax=Natronomicrosphaera hydrolytica TaxID=3242702 RepID=A0ABV4U1T6_9BACT
MDIGSLPEPFQWLIVIAAIIGACGTIIGGIYGLYRGCRWCVKTVPKSRRWAVKRWGARYLRFEEQRELSGGQIITHRKDAAKRYCPNCYRSYRVRQIRKSKRIGNWVCRTCRNRFRDNGGFVTPQRTQRHLTERQERIRTSMEGFGYPEWRQFPR